MFRELVPWFFVLLHGILFLIHEVYGKQHWDTKEYVFAAMLFAAVIAVPIFIWHRTSRKWRSKMQLVTTSLHQAAEKIRDHYFLLPTTVPDRDMFCCGREIVVEIKSALEHLTHESCHVSIILVDNPNKLQLPEDSSAFLLCRSDDKGTAVPREGDNDPHPLESYTPLWEIINGRLPCYFRSWIVRNWILSSWGGTIHRDPNTKWNSDYNSVMAVPIRINKVYLPHMANYASEFVVSGFIWCDWSANFPFWKKHVKLYSNLLLTVADGFFHYLERVDEIKCANRNT